MSNSLENKHPAMVARPGGADALVTQMYQDGIRNMKQQLDVYYDDESRTRPANMTNDKLFSEYSLQRIASALAETYDGIVPGPEWKPYLYISAAPDDDDDGAGGGGG